jgi:hypothetical protein
MHMRVGRLGRWGGLALAAAVALAGGTSTTALAKSPAPFDQLQLASPNATRVFGPATITGPNANQCSASPSTVQDTLALSADANGDGVLTIDPTQTFVREANSVYETGPSQLELDWSGSRTQPQETSTSSSTLDGYGTSFRGTYVVTFTFDVGGSCTVTRPETLTLEGTGLTLGPSTSGQQQQQVNSAAAQTQVQLQNALNGAVKAIIRNLQATFDAASAGTVDDTVTLDGAGGSGSSVLVFVSGSSVLVFDRSGSSGSNVLTFGSSAGGVLTFDGSGGNGSSVLTFDGSSGSGSALLTFEGSGGSGSSILVPPPPSAGSTTDTIVAFDGSGGAGSSIAADRSAPDAGIASARSPKRVRLCIRRHKHAHAKCMTLRPAPVPFIATASTTFTAPGTQSLKLPVSRTGNLILIAAREADRLYHKRHPHGHHEPLLGLKIVVSFKPS